MERGTERNVTLDHFERLLCVLEQSYANPLREALQQRRKRQSSIGVNKLWGVSGTPEIPSHLRKDVDAMCTQVGRSGVTPPPSMAGWLSARPGRRSMQHLNWEDTIRITTVYG